MGVIQFEISESDFSRKKSSHYELSILQRVDSFVFMATDKQQRVLLLRECRLENSLDASAARVEELRNYVARDNLLRQPFRHVRVGLVTEKHTLIPNRLFNPQEKTTYLEQITELPAGWLVKSDDIDGLAAQNVYAYPGDILNFLHKQWPGSRLFHSASSFLLTHRSPPSLLEGQQVFAHVWPQQIQLLYYEDSDLQFVNMFPYYSAKDFTYYLMLVFDQFALDPKSIPVRLSGQISSDSEIYRMITRYVQKVNILPPPAFVHLGKALQAKSPSFYYDLFTLLLCN